MINQKEKVIFYSQALLGNKTGVGYYNSVLLEQLIRAKSNKELVLIYFESPFSRKYTNYLKNLYPGLELRAHRFIPKKIAIKLIGTVFELHSGFLWPGGYQSAIFPNFYGFKTKKSANVALSIPDLAFLKYPEVLPSARKGIFKKLLPSGPDFLLRATKHQIPKATYILTISQAIKKEINIEFGVPESNIIVTSLAPTESYEIENNLNSNFFKPKNYFLFVGTLEPRKNLLTLLRAYELLPRDISDKYSLVLAGGTGWKYEEILDRINLMTSNGYKIYHTGYIDQDYKSFLYKNASIYIQPSLYEGFGMPILEAMNYKIPILCSDIEVFREVAEGAAEYFDKNNAGDLVKKITSLLSDKEKQQKLVKIGTKRFSVYRLDTSGVDLLLNKL